MNLLQENGANPSANSAADQRRDVAVAQTKLHGSSSQDFTPNAEPPRDGERQTSTRAMAWKAMPWLGAGLGLAMATLVFSLGPYAELVGRMDGVRPFDEFPASDLSEAKERLRTMDRESLRLYVSHLRWDVAAMLGNAFLLGGLLLALGKRWPKVAFVALILPLTFVIADLVENAGIATWIADTATVESVQRVKLATTIKFTAFGVSALTIAGLFVVQCTLWLVNKRRA